MTLRIMCLSNMYPSPESADYGAFVERMCDALEEHDAHVDRVVITRRASGAVRTPAKYTQLAGHAIHAARHVDVIWAHYLFPTGLIAAIAGRATRTPWVVTAHGGDVANLRHRSVRRLSTPGVQGAARVICVSQWLADRMADEGLAPRDPAIVSMGMDDRRFQIGDRGAARARLGIPADVPLILAVGGLTDRKNPLALVRALATLRRGVLPHVRLALVGDGPEAGIVDATARHLGVSDALIRTGTVMNIGVTDWMTACDVFAQVSRNEPLGVAALEAMASGRPVVGTAVGGLREVVPDGVAGVIVDPTDDSAIAAALARMIAAAPDANACRDAALRHSLSHETARVFQILSVAAGGPA
ncbi:MAG: glycosyltransferase family 4 protein [Thermoleophilia bacterium]|nr:glycosyltransferase family 4 protein [Thermoleophilia bacterium]